MGNDQTDLDQAIVTSTVYWYILIIYAMLGLVFSCKMIYAVKHHIKHEN